MLRWIRVRNIAVIDELEVNFEPGLNLLTGETGAGKSILVDALGLILGARASTDLVRSGATSALVEAGFELEPFPQELGPRLSAAGIDVERGEIVIRREVFSSSRGRVAVNGCGVATTLLHELAPYLADIHGQAGHVSLLRPGAGLGLIDRLGQCESLREEAGAVYRHLARLEQERTELEREARDKKNKQELLKFQLSEIDRTEIRTGEDRRLEEERTILAHSVRLRTAAEEAYAVLYEEEDSVLARLAQIWKRVAELAEIDSRLGSFADSQASVTSQLEDLALFLRDYREQIRFTPGRLDEVEERLAMLERLKNKYGGSLEAVTSHRRRSAEMLDRLATDEERLGHLQTEIDGKRHRYLDLAKRLSEHRRETSEVLEKRVEQELRSLAMEKSRLSIQLLAVGETDDWSSWRETGLDEVHLLFSANPGEELRLVSRIASGGESSRFMLALESVATKGESPKTLVFDEVDTGIGGRVADVVGEKLNELSRVHQVVCITHLPQIACFADAHYRIEKAIMEGRTVTRIERLSHKGRVNEIARMLAGAVITESARRHAEQLVTEKS